MSELKPSEIIKIATDAGCYTVSDYAVYCYKMGVANTLKEVTEDIKEYVKGDDND